MMVLASHGGFVCGAVLAASNVMPVQAAFTQGSGAVAGGACSSGLVICAMHAASYMRVLLWLDVSAGHMISLCLQWHISSLTLQLSFRE